MNKLEASTILLIEETFILARKFFNQKGEGPTLILLSFFKEYLKVSGPSMFTNNSSILFTFL